MAGVSSPVRGRSPYLVLGSGLLAGEGEAGAAGGSPAPPVGGIHRVVRRYGGARVTSQTSSRQAGRGRELGAFVTDAEPGLAVHLHVAGGEDALAPGASDAALVPVLIHLADQADALPLGV